ncbi:MAG: hypothetical protein IKS85_05515 [Lachnospiraceae bacterium]|nr:hypothetical protein [Lachnospiraceae bacterium]
MSLEDILLEQHNKHAKVTLVEEFHDEIDPSITFSVVDRTSLVLHQFDTRRLEFQNGSTYAYSTIYLDKSRRIQPIYESVQYLADAFFPSFDGLERALVLGCAGCSIPRFLALSSANCQITGIEYSEKMVEIARKHFINDPLFENFDLRHEDAFTFVKKTKEKYNYLYVDLFTSEKNHPRMLSDDFLRDIDLISAKESIAIFNLLSLNREESNKFALRHLHHFTAAYLFDETFHYYVAFVNTADPAKRKAFEERASKSVRILERYVSR